MTGSSFLSNGIVGFRVPTSGSVDGLTVTNSHFDGNVYGMEIFMATGSGSVFQKINISQSTFNNNSSKGTYFEKLNNATFSNLTVTNSGYSGANAVGFNINLKYNAYSNIVISSSDIIGCGTGDPTNGGGVVIEARGTGSDSSYSANPATLSDVTLANLNVTGSLDGIRFGEPGKNNVGPTGVTIYDCNLSGNSTNGVHNDTQTLTGAISNWWGNVSGPSGAANPYGTGSGVNGLVSFSPWLGDGTDTSPNVGFQPNATPIEYPPVQLVFTTQPAGANLGSPLSSQPVVQLEDTNGNVTPWADPAVTLALGNDVTGAVLTGTYPQTAVSGVATFTDLAVTFAGGANLTLIASAPALPPATSTAFTITNPAPTITNLVPAFAVAGDAGFTLAVYGNNFGSEYSTVQWNGTNVPTAFVSSTQLNATISAADIASPGTASVSVFNIMPGGGESAPVTVTIYPVPTVVYVNASYTSGGADDGHLFGYDAFSTVQAGINRVAANGTVNVAAGTYSESDTVNKPVTLLGANHGVAGCGSRGLESTINAGAGNAITIAASNVVVDGFTLVGVESVVDTGGYVGVTVQNNVITAAAVGVAGVNLATTVGANFTVQNNCITLTSQLAGSTPTIGIAIYGVTGTQTPVLLNNNIQGGFYGYQLYSLNLAGGAPTVVKGGNITGAVQAVAVLNINPLNQTVFNSSVFTVDSVTASGFTGTGNPQAGVYVFTGGPNTNAVVTGTITNVNVTGVGKVSSDSAGIDLADFSTGVAVRQRITIVNSIISSNANRGILASCSSSSVSANVVATIVGCTLSGNGFDPFGASGNPGFGIIARNNAQVTVSNCFITNPATVTAPYTVTAVEADANTAPLGPTLVVTDCSIVNNGNPSGYLASQDAGTLNASGNWWGTTSDTAITNLMTGVVDFTPYLDSGVDTDAVTPGFQGDFSALHVTTLGAQTGATGRIQEGINTVSGGTVYLQAGTFVEGPQILINKDITMIGSGTASTIVKPAANTGNSSDSRGWWFVPTLTTFNLSQMTLDGTGKLVWQAIRSYGLTSVDHVHFTQIQYNPSGDYQGTGIVGFSMGTNAAVLNVSNCQLDNIGRIGIFYFGICTGTCSNNVYTGKGSGDWLDYGVELGAGASALIISNTVTGNTGVASIDGSTSAGVTADSDFGPNTKATVRGNTLTGNTLGAAIGFGVSGDTSAVMLEGNNLAGNAVDGIQVVGGATVDAGDCTGGNVTGLGSSSGGNNLSGYGFDGASPWAIENLNGSGPAVLAYQNSYGAVVGNNLASLFSGNVLADQSGGLLVQYPGPQTVMCLSSEPAGANTLAAFVAQGGAVSATTATVSFIDSVVSSNYPSKQVISRQYSLSDICSQTASGNQSITIADTIPPTVSAWPANETLDVNGQCQVAVPDLTVLVVGASDNCGILSITQNPLANTLISLGTNLITVTVTDQGGNSISTNVVLTVIDSNPTSLTYVDTHYASLAAGTVVKFPYGGSGMDHYVGCDAFGTIQGGINRVAASGIVNVAAGTYPEVINIGKPLTLSGAQAGQDANARFAAFTAGPNGPKASPSVESIITAAADDPADGTQ